MNNRQNELTEILRNAADAYYNGMEVMTDREYDALFDELAALERESGVSLPGSVVTNVGAPVNGALAKVKHETPMLSLAKTKDRESLAAWLGDKAGCLSWKLDGLTVALTYENGHLVQAVTRGNGTIGEDVTMQARFFKYVPQTIDYDGKLVVRGEALMTFAEFDRINTGQPEAERYKNPRNLASGTVRAIDLNVLMNREIEFHPFELVYKEDQPNGFYASLSVLRGLGFSPVGAEIVTSENVVEAIGRYEETISHCGFPTDGLVLTFDDVEYGRSLGITGHHPRSGIAFKWADDTYETKLTGIEWQTSRTGRINPVAMFEPVEIEGTTVARASLHNVSIVKELELGIGDTITVYKANLVIPAVADNLTRSDTVTLPDRCPVCGGPVAFRNDHGSEYIYCENDDCAAKSVKRFVHFASRDAMNIVGLSDERLQVLADAGIVRSYADILDLPNRRKDVVGKVEGFGDGVFDNIAAAIESARHTEAARVLYSFGIRECGRTASKAICKTFRNDVEEVMRIALEGMTDAFTCVEGVGPIMARELVDYIQKNEQTMRDVLARVDVTDKNKVGALATGGFVNGKTFVITGAVHVFANRNAFKTYVESCGGKVSGSVSKRTDYLVTNDTDTGTAKNRKARDLGIPVITEDEFCELAGYGKDNGGSKPEKAPEAPKDEEKPAKKPSKKVAAAKKAAAKATSRPKAEKKPIETVVEQFKTWMDCATGDECLTMGVLFTMGIC